MGENREAAEQGEQPVEECVLMRLLFVAGRGAVAFAMVVIAGMVLDAMMPGWTDREAWWPWGSWAFIILFALGKEIERFSRKANRVCQQCKKQEADGWENTGYCRHCEIRMFDLVCWECGDRRPSVKSGGAVRPMPDVQRLAPGRLASVQSGRDDLGRAPGRRTR